MKIIISLLVGMIKTIKFIPINIKYSFSIKDCKSFFQEEAKVKAFFRKWYILYPFYIIAGLIATIGMIPVNFVLSIKDDYKKYREGYKKKK